MTDKERIYSQLIHFMSFTFSENKWEYVTETNTKKGDIVMGCTNWNHDFNIAFVEEVKNSSNLVVKEINTGKTTDYTNELFMVYKGTFSELDKLTAQKWLFRLRVGKALNRDHYMLALTNIFFDDNKCVGLEFRKKFVHDIITIPFTHEKTLSKVSISYISKQISDGEELDKERKKQ